jgi:hypothetical protein
VADVARDRQTDLSIALADGRCFEFGNALFEVGAAVSPEISGVRISEHASTSEYRYSASRLQQSPIHTYIS